ncbi:hypothetical protein K466DRAFT_57408 [Polyporus arcularius HHB13444]|uniref:TNase-like domain-containing protein n=1 Tax=Polyporus arcularius HHB13444 TaxID=1314778 RepID=A0A5C3PHK6_9APHY|nr:hypothetical protein K466DRAFT_57408 [Polyporus arcularius HHB13444]
MLRGRRWLRGVVTRVGDGDNFKLCHTLGFGWGWLKAMPEDRKDEIIHICLAGIDALEGSGYSGRESQEGAKECHEWLRQQGHLLKRDHYDRIVAAVFLKPPLIPGVLFTRGALYTSEHSLSLKMLREGTAVVHEAKGAVYGDLGSDVYKRAQKEAQKEKKGTWKNQYRDTCTVQTTGPEGPSKGRQVCLIVYW